MSAAPRVPGSPGAEVTRTVGGAACASQLSQQHHGSVLQGQAALWPQAGSRRPGSQQKPQHWVHNRRVIQCEVVAQVPGQVVPQPPMEHDLREEIPPHIWPGSHQGAG